jgi:TolB protein
MPLLARRRSSLLTASLLLAATLLLSLWLAAGPASAGVAGNGEIVFASDRPDGADRHIWLMDPNGANPKQITNEQTLDFTPAWSPDGALIAFSRLDHAASVNTFTMGPDGSSVTRITSSAGGGAGGIANINPSWRPNGRWFAFTRVPFLGNDPPATYKIRSDGTGLTLLTSSTIGDASTAWSPDGKRILFTRGGFTSAIWSMRPDGSGERQLSAEGPQIDSAAWSPNGRRIAFQRARGAGSALFKMHRDGSNVKRLTNGKHVDGNPTWSPNGKWIAFDRSPSQTSASGDIFKMHPNGHNRVRLTSGGSNIEPSWRPLP